MSAAHAAARDRRVVERALDARARRPAPTQADALLARERRLESRACAAREIDFVKQARERALGIRAFVRGARRPRRRRRPRRATSRRDAIDAAWPTRPSRWRARPRPTRARACPTAASPSDAARSRALRSRATAASRSRRASTTRSAPRPRRARVDPRIVELRGLAGRLASSRRVAYGNSAGFVGSYESARPLAGSRAARARETARMQRDYWLTARAPPRRARGRRRGRPARRASARCAGSARAARRRPARCR